MAEIIIGAVVPILIEKLSEELIKFARSEGIDSKLKEWKKKLPLIQDVLADAGQKEITQKAVERWLIELQDVAYDIDDVLDDIATQVMKRKLNQEESHATTSKVMKIIIPACCTNLTPHNFMYGREISSKLDEITARLDNLFQWRKDLGLKVNVETSTRRDKPLGETSLVNESEILGREEDKQALLEKLLGVEASSNKNVKVVSIVGLGGVGKTTLAKVLYNDKQVKGHFELRAWVSVSNEFDVFNVSKVIYQAVCGENKEFADLNLLHEALKEKLSNKRFILVLDDVWNEDPDRWQVLKQPLVGAPGSKVIVTTRNTKVALAMNSVLPHNLGLLSHEIALSLFAQYALDEEENIDNHPSLKSIAQGIVKKCDGLPLALVTLGRVLRTKGMEDVEWEELLKSEIWSSEDGSGILPALKLSYYHLPSHLKQVFAYCSMFPKKTKFEKKKLILLWMAQGFLSLPKGNNQPMESLGHKYFQELLLRSFLQPVANDESLYTMHDLINDLATSVAGQFFIRLDENKDLNGSNEAYEKFRHFSFTDGQRILQDREFKALHRLRCLRTFLHFSTPKIQKTSASIILESFSRLESIRVLSLSNCTITEVPQSIGSLKHLRYLNFSNTGIKQIPEQVSELYNLQSLLVRGCYELYSLPVSFSKLINMRHLDMLGTWSLNKLPLGIGGLTSLQTLSKVIIEKDNGFKLSELKGLDELRGELSIEGLQKVIDPTQANDADLQQKKGLENLCMKWTNYSGDPTNQDDVIEKLRPHPKLKILRIEGYHGMKFPSWLGDPSFDRLTELVLNECYKCTELVTLGNLTSLQKLEVRECPKLESINKGEKEVVNVRSSIIMGSLREVRLSYCYSLKSYSCPTSVERLEIECCSSMTSLSFHRLHEEELSSSSTSSSSSPNLKNLWIRNCKHIKSISKEHLQSLTSLEEMLIVDCPSMEDSFPSSGMWPPNLKYLKIGVLKKPMSEWGLQNYPASLVRLKLYGKNSGVVSFGIMEEQDHNHTTCFLLPPSLTELAITDFEEVESISEVLQHLPCLRQLDIWRCPKLTDVPKKTSSLDVSVDSVITLWSRALKNVKGRRG